MAEILLCSAPLKADQLHHHCSIDDQQLAAVQHTGEMIERYRPYLLSRSNATTDRGIAQCLAPQPVAREITNLALSYGDANVMALAEIGDKLYNYNIGLAGASTSVYANRIGGFADAVQEYQAALLEYRDVMRSKSTGQALAKQKVTRAFTHLQSKFRHELHAVSSQLKSKKGNPLNNPTRAMNIARSSRTAVKLEVSSQVQAHRLAQFARQAKFLGNGLAVIDFGSRVGNVHNSYQSEGEWERELFIESTSFTASAIAGAAAVKSGLTLLLIATPVGWIGLLAGGLATAGVAAGASLMLNQAIKENAGDWYDSIIGWLYGK